MKNIYTFALALVAIVFSSCGGTMSPSVYNETIVAMHTKTADDLNAKMEQIFDRANTSKEQAQTLIDELNTEYSDNLTRLGEMKYPEAAADWHKSTTDMMTYVKDSVLPLFSESLNHEPESPEWYDVWNKLDENMNGTASDLEDKMIEEQEKYASSIGMDIR